MSPTRNRPLRDVTSLPAQSSRKGSTVSSYDDTIVLSDPQTLFKHVWYFARATPQALGTVGEIYAREMLEAAGYYARPSSRFQGDLLVRDPLIGTLYRVEVKTARKNRDGWWQFLLKKEGKTDSHHSDFLILLQVTDSYRVIPYIIPTSVLSVNQIKISSPELYRGKYARFRAQLVPAVNTAYQLTPTGKLTLWGTLPY